MEVYLDEWGFEVDKYNRVLDNQYNYDLELQYQEEEARAKYAQVNAGDIRRREATPVYDSRISRDRIVTSSGGGSRHPALSRGHQQHEQTRHSTVMDYPVATTNNRAKLGTSSKKMLDLDMEYEEITKQQTNHKVERAAPVNEDVPIAQTIVKPIDGNYHDILLPTGFKQTKIYLPPNELDDKTYVKYYKREITNEIGDDDMDNRFGESYFGNGKGFIPVSIEQAEIISLDKEDNAAVLENGEDIIDQVLYLVPQDRIDSSKIYVSDIFIAAKYYNNVGKNLFTDLTIAPVNDPVDLMNRLEGIYSRYFNNEYTKNGILKIDSALANSLNTYLAAYCGKPGFFVKGFMLGVKPMYNKIRADIKDTDLRKNLLNAITSFLTNLMVNIKEYTDVIPANDTIELFCPTRELMVVSKNKNILNELKELASEKPNEHLFKLIDRTYTPYIHDMVERLDKDKVIQKYNRLVFFTFENMYSIIKSATGCYYISNFNNLKQ